MLSESLPVLYTECLEMQSQSTITDRDHEASDRCGAIGTGSEADKLVHFHKENGDDKRRR